MDPRPQSTPVHSLVITGAGCIRNEVCEVTSWLTVKKNRKYMGLQDVLAVIAAGRALQAAGLFGRPLGERAGLYLTVGHIPFEQADLAALIDASRVEGKYSPQAFLSAGFQAANPLLTFRCLSNMPAYHVSFNFDLRGPYIVTYPDEGQWHIALQTAVDDLNAHRADVALIGAAAHQRNYLVEHHFSRLEPPVAPTDLENAAGFIVLEREESALARSAKIRGRFLGAQLAYQAGNPLAGAARPPEGGPVHFGDHPAAALLKLCQLCEEAAFAENVLRHEFSTRDGISGWSEWGPA